MPLPATDTRRLFRPLCRDIVALLRTLPGGDWERPTMAGDWHVRDVVAHLLDTALRRLSFDRDGRMPPPPARPIAGDRDLVAFINGLNASWVRAADRLSPRMLADLYAFAGEELSTFMEGARLDDAARFPVSWAGQAGSRAWMDIGREFTEVWHHGAQVRDAVGAAPFADKRWLRAVIEIALQAVPHAYRDIPGQADHSLAIDIVGAAGGAWTLRYRGSGWDLDEGRPPKATAQATMSDDTAWRLFFNALSPSSAQQLIRLEGDVALAGPLLRVRSVIV